MRRRIAFGIGALALSWLAGQAAAGDLLYQRSPVRPSPLPAPAAEASFSSVDLLAARVRGAFEGGPLLLGATPVQAPASGFAVDRPPAAAVVTPVQYVVPSSLAAPPAPGADIKPMPLVAGAPAPLAVMGGCPCTIEECAGGCGVLSVDIGIYVLEPRWTSNPAYRVQAVDGDLDTRSQEDFTTHMEGAPVICVAYVWGDGLGIRGRYWLLDADMDEQIVNDGTLLISSATPLGLGIADVTTDDTEGVRWGFDGDLTIRVFDLEATQNLTWDCCTFVVSAGSRLAYLSQSYDATRLEPGDARAAALLSGQRFRGAGPTAALTVRRPLGDFGWAFFATGRGSVLFGRQRQTAALATLEEPAFLEASLTQDDVLPVLEIELGAQYAFCWSGMHIFCQAGVVGQSWIGAGNASNTDLIVGSANDDDQANLGFIGFLITAGVDF